MASKEQSPASRAFPLNAEMPSRLRRREEGEAAAETADEDDGHTLGEGLEELEQHSELARDA